MHFIYIFLYIFLMVFFIGLIILAHESGHFLCSKMLGVRADKFAFGLPFCGPIIFRKKICNTEIIIHLLFFFGGYVAYPDSNPNSDLPLNSNHRFLNKTPFEKILITLSGIFMNILISFILIMLIGIIWKVIPANDYNVKFLSFKNNAQASITTSGLEKGDIIYSINNNKLKDNIALQEYLRVYYKPLKEKRKQENIIEYNTNNLLIFYPDIYVKHTNTLNNIIVIREGKKLQLTPVYANEDFSLGINTEIKENFLVVNSVSSLFKNTAKSIINQLYLLLYYVKELVTGQLSITDIRGIISIVKIGSELSFYDSLYRGLWLMSFLSINMAVVNLIPFPVLDGGKLLIILSGRMFQKKVKRKTINNILSFAFKLFYVIANLILLNDIIAIISGVV